MWPATIVPLNINERKAIRLFQWANNGNSVANRVMTNGEKNITMSEDTESITVRRPPVLGTPEAVENLTESVALDTIEYADSDPNEVADRLSAVARRVRTEYCEE